MISRLSHRNFEPIFLLVGDACVKSDSEFIGANEKPSRRQPADITPVTRAQRLRRVDRIRIDIEIDAPAATENDKTSKGDKDLFFHDGLTCIESHATVFDWLDGLKTPDLLR